MTAVDKHGLSRIAKQGCPSRGRLLGDTFRVILLAPARLAGCSARKHTISQGSVCVLVRDVLSRAPASSCLVRTKRTTALGVETPRPHSRLTSPDSKESLRLSGDVCLVR